MDNADYGQQEGALSRAADIVERAKDELNTLNNNLDTDVTTATAKWRGRGSHAFDGLKEAIDTEQRRILTALHQFTLSLGQTEKVNASNDEEQGAGIQAIAKKVGGNV